MKKIFKYVFISLMCVEITGCIVESSYSSTISLNNISSSAYNGELIELKVWGAPEEHNLLLELIDEFKSINLGKNYSITLSNVDPGEATSRYLENPNNAADIFAYANDHINILVDSKVLKNFSGTTYENIITNNNVASSIRAATVKDNLYGFPFITNNGYFLYYDTRFFNGSNLSKLKNWDSLLSHVKSLDKRVYFDITNGFYLPSFFFSFGIDGELGIDENGKQTCNFNNAKGLIAIKAALSIANNPVIENGNDTVFTGKFGIDFVAGVSGIWNYETLKNKIGDNNIGAIKLPEFTVDKVNYQMGSFSGYQLMGVSNHSKYPDEATALANYFTSEEAQLRRFYLYNYAPTNINLLNHKDIKTNKMISALLTQNLYSHPMRDILGSFWTPMGALGDLLRSGEYNTDAELQSLLNNLVDNITK